MASSLTRVLQIVVLFAALAIAGCTPQQLDSGIGYLLHADSSGQEPKIEFGTSAATFRTCVKRIHPVPHWRSDEYGQQAGKYPDIGIWEVGWDKRTNDAEAIQSKFATIVVLPSASAAREFGALYKSQTPYQYKRRYVKNVLILSHHGDGFEDLPASALAAVKKCAVAASRGVPQSDEKFTKCKADGRLYEMAVRGWSCSEALKYIPDTNDSFNGTTCKQPELKFRCVGRNVCCETFTYFGYDGRREWVLM